MTTEWAASSIKETHVSDKFTYILIRELEDNDTMVLVCTYHVAMDTLQILSSVALDTINYISFSHTHIP